MTPDQITQLRQLLQKARKAFWNDEDWTWYKVETTRVLPLIDQALALLPCPTCSDSGRIPTFDQASQTADADPCPDCQPRTCVCCEEVTEENARLHRNCGK